MMPGRSLAMLSCSLFMSEAGLGEGLARITRTSTEEISESDALSNEIGVVLKVLLDNSDCALCLLCRVID